MLRLRKGVAKFGGKKPNKAAIKLPLRDGDIERDDEGVGAVLGLEKQKLTEGKDLILERQSQRTR